MSAACHLANCIDRHAHDLGLIEVGTRERQLADLGIAQLRAQPRGGLEQSGLRYRKTARAATRYEPREPPRSISKAGQLCSATGRAADPRLSSSHLEGSASRIHIFNQPKFGPV